MTDINQAGNPPEPPPMPTSGAHYTPGTAAGPSYKGRAIGSMVCAIVGIFIMQPILGIIAIVLGAVARGKMRTANNLDGRGFATAGLVIGIIEVAVSIIVIAIVLLSINDIFSHGR